MMHLDNEASPLRAESGHSQRVTSVELFFDLVYVFAVTQLSHLLLDHLSVLGALQTLLLLLAIWWAWVYTAWFTNWFDPDHALVRLVLVIVMLASLLMSAMIPEAFGERGLAFALTYVAIQVGRSAFVIVLLSRVHRLRVNFQRILCWSIASGVLWVIGGLVDETARNLVWLAAVLVDYGAPVGGFMTPGLGRSRTEDWTIAGGHLAERCQLLVIVAFGESILATGATLSELPFTAPTLAAFTIAFVGSVALWWIYFDRSAEAGSEIITEAADPGRLGRSAYTYFHLPMVAGIIVSAVADDLTIAHADLPGSAALTAVALGGPALYLLGHGLFKRALAGVFPTSRVIAIIALAALVPVGLAAPALVTGAAAAVVAVAVAAWDTRMHRRPLHPREAPAAR